MKIHSQVEKLYLQQNKKIEKSEIRGKLESEIKKEKIADASDDVVFVKCVACEYEKAEDVYTRDAKLKRDRRLFPQQDLSEEVKNPNIKIHKQVPSQETAEEIKYPVKALPPHQETVEAEAAFDINYNRYLKAHPGAKRLLYNYNQWLKVQDRSVKPGRESFDKFISNSPKAEAYVKHHHDFFDKFFSNPSSMESLDRVSKLRPRYV